MTPLLIIPSFISKEKHAHALIKTVSTLRASTDKNVLIIDDGSPAKNISNLYSEIKNKYDDIEIYEKDANEGFSKTVNIGLAKALANGQDACLVNADIEFVNENWLEEMQKTEADIIGALLLYPNFLIQSAGTYFSRITRAFIHRFVGSPPNLPAAQVECECPVTAALQYIRHDTMAKIGIYDEEFTMGCEDVDYLIRALHAGFRSVYNPKVIAIHHESLFRGNESDKVRQWQAESFLHLFNKYYDVDFRGIAPTMFE